MGSAVYSAYWNLGLIAWSLRGEDACRVPKDSGKKW